MIVASVTLRTAFLKIAIGDIHAYTTLYNAHQLVFQSNTQVQDVKALHRNTTWTLLT